eukprot:SAG31_NODE_3468_length_4238_cov_112.307321_1_plen_114_part_00
MADAQPAAEHSAAEATVESAPSRVHVEIVEGRNLRAMDCALRRQSALACSPPRGGDSHNFVVAGNGTSDPYCEARVVAHNATRNSTVTKTEKNTTSIKYRTLNPVGCQEFPLG